MAFTDGSQSNEQLYIKQNCAWSVSPTSSWGIFVYFTRFSVFNGAINLYQGPVAENKILITIQNSNAVPAPIVFPFSTLGVSYTTSAAGSGLGFYLSYYGLSSDRISAPGNGIVPLMCSSMISLTLYSGNKIFPKTNLTWLVEPASSTGSIYFSISSLNLTGCNGFLEIYDGPSITSPLLGSFCGSSLPVPFQWIQSTSALALVRFVSASTHVIEGNFDLSFYSDGLNSHCGFATNPAVMTSPSMIFSDGSSSSTRMFPNQACEWLIKPTGLKANSDLIVIELLENDLAGGAYLTIYDGISGPLLWMCTGCSIVPRPLVARSGSLHVVFSTGSISGNQTLGMGFRAFYWTVNSDDSKTNSSQWMKYGNGSVLVMPPLYNIISTKNNHTAAWHLGMSYYPSTMTFQPRVKSIIASVTSSINSMVQDGRPVGSTNFASENDVGSTCGFVHGNGTTYLSGDNNVKMMASQWAGSFIQSTAASKRVLEVSGSWDVTASDSTVAQFVPSTICKYVLDSGSKFPHTQSIEIKIEGVLGIRTNVAAESLPTTTPNIARLRIYGGIYGNDALLVDSLVQPINLDPYMYLAPCGRATIILEMNTSLTTVVEHGLKFTYRVRETDKGDDCAAYSKFYLFIFLRGGNVLQLTYLIFF